MIPIRDHNPTRGPTVITWLVIAACAAVFFLVQPAAEPEASRFMYRQATIPCEIGSGEPLTIGEIETGVCRAGSAPAEDRFAPDKHVYLSLLTAVFLHGSVLHLLGNVWVLFVFGNNVEDELGSFGYTVFYVAAGLAASIGHVVLHAGSTVPVVGASGAIAGVMGAYLVLHPWARVTSIVPPLFFLPFRLPAAVYLVIWFALQFALAGEDTNVAWEAHVVGFGFGFVVAGALRAAGAVPVRRGRRPRTTGRASGRRRAR